MTLNDGYGNPVSGKTIALASTRGDILTAVGGATVTSAQGQVQFSVTNTVAGSSVFTATDTSDANLAIVGSAATVAYVAGAESASASTLAISASSYLAGGSVVVTATVNDQYANPISGKYVVLTSSRGSGVDTISGASPSTTPSSGQVVFTVSSAVAGPATFTARTTN